jgi:outer membrane protein OmpA-like peptidoglycan-associated protein
MRTRRTALFWLLILVLALPQSSALDDAARSIQQARRLLEELGDEAFAGPRSDLDDVAILSSLERDIESMEFDDDPIGNEPARSVFGSNPLTQDRNPLIEGNVREQSLARAIDNVGFEMASRHLKEQAAALRRGDIDRAGWYEHVAKCTKLCNPVVRSLLAEHVRQVASRPRLLTTFATDQATLSPDVSQRLNAFVKRQLRSGDPVQFLLIGRASRTGQRAYNRELSARRVLSVKRELAGMGLPADQVTGFWLGYEPPQITDEIARAYALDPTLGNLARNQSVLLVAYEPGG